MSVSPVDFVITSHILIIKPYSYNHKGNGRFENKL
jgi:hypothetical protein